MNSDVEQPEVKPVMVVSHERSGTHFLMNALSLSYGFAKPEHLSLDRAVVNMNYFHPPSMASFFQLNRDYEPGWIRKSHHPFSFFAPVIGQILEDIDVFYIYRDPRDVAHSFRHFLNALDWPEGPKRDSASDFIRAAPEGQMLRYQHHQLPDMLERWRVHVEGWAKAAEEHGGISLVRYENLADRYDETIRDIGQRMGWPRIGRERPMIDEGTVQKSARNHASNSYTSEDIAYFKTRIGQTMRRLGYEI